MMLKKILSIAIAFSLLTLILPETKASKNQENVIDIGEVFIFCGAIGFTLKIFFLNNTEATWFAKNGRVNGTVELRYSIYNPWNREHAKLMGTGIILFYEGKKIGGDGLLEIFKKEKTMIGKFKIPVSFEAKDEIVIKALIWAITFPSDPFRVRGFNPLINFLTLGLFTMRTIKIKINVIGCSYTNNAVWPHTRYDKCNTGFTPAMGKGSVYSYGKRIFTKHLIGMGAGEPKVFDIDNDGKAEIIFGTQTGYVYAVENGWKVDWKCQVGEDVSLIPPELGDVDGDGYYEIIISTSNIIPSKNAGVKVVDNNGKLLAEWIDESVVCPYGEPRATDINGDGKDEILVGSLGDEDMGNRFYVLSYENGRLKELWKHQMHFWVLCAPAVADINNDGKLEIIVTSYDMCVYCFDANGNLLWRYITKGGIQHAYRGAIKRLLFYPVVSDLNNDGYKEIIVNTALYDKKNWSGIYCLDSNGNLIWVRYFDGLVRDALAVADINNDGFNDILFGINNGTIGVLDRNGNLLWKYKLPEKYFEGLGQAEFYPAIADLDGNGYKEIVVTAWHHGIFIFSHDGRLVKEWPYYPKGYFGFLGSAIADIDGNGDLEIVTLIAALFGGYGIFGKIIVLDQ